MILEATLGEVLQDLLEQRLVLGVHILNALQTLNKTTSNLSKKSNAKIYLSIFNLLNERELIPINNEYNMSMKLTSLLNLLPAWVAMRNLSFLLLTDVYV